MRPHYLGIVGQKRCAARGRRRRAPWVSRLSSEPASPATTSRPLVSLDLAEAEPVGEIRNQWTTLARDYAYLASALEPTGRGAAVYPPLALARLPATIKQSGRKPLAVRSLSR